MSVPTMRVRRVGGAAVVGVGPHAAGDPLPPALGLAGLCGREPAVVLDLPANAFLPSALLGQLVRSHQTARAAGGRLRVCCPPGPAREELAAVGLDRLLPTFDTLADALAGL